MSFKRYFTYVEPVEIAQADNKKAFKITQYDAKLKTFHRDRNTIFLAHLSRRIMGELIVYQSLRCPQFF